MNKSEIEHRRFEIAKKFKKEIKEQGIAIEEIERQSISKRIIYNIIQGKGYTINSLIQFIEVLKNKNEYFDIIMKTDFQNMPFQIDFKTNHTPKGEVMNFINENSTRVQHLLDSKPRVSRWWFEDLSKASKVIVMIEENNLNLDYKLVASDINAIFIEKGEF